MNKLLDTVGEYKIYDACSKDRPKGGIFVMNGAYSYLNTDGITRGNAGSGWFDSLDHVYEVLGVKKIYLGGE